MCIHAHHGWLEQTPEIKLQPSLTYIHIHIFWQVTQTSESEVQTTLHTHILVDGTNSGEPVLSLILPSVHFPARSFKRYRNHNVVTFYFPVSE